MQQVPDYEDRLSKFERMCVVKTFREDRTLIAAADYIADALGQVRKEPCFCTNYWIFIECGSCITRHLIWLTYN
jgi:hypothetical protein